jgi:hypothetical protein
MQHEMLIIFGSGKNVVVSDIWVESNFVRGKSIVVGLDGLISFKLLLYLDN